MDIVSDSIKKCWFSIFFYICVHVFERVLQYLESAVDLFIADDEWWFDTDSFGTIESTSYEHSPLE